ncbi:hypothetical protein CISG_05424 [Coccidioides immitis RMSCC 3703]|uniref:Uncharacterized protein n=1 Tax=Coccidioides immitis RMSCC 3703 TaxID=454286 RepID=A0A0J8QSW8_COCIT|nr:hypothetical protein CISG_05424 [Coccidioides immitis RMSCC 3703]
MGILDRKTREILRSSRSIPFEHNEALSTNHRRRKPSGGKETFETQNGQELIELESLQEVHFTLGPFFPTRFRAQYFHIMSKIVERQVNVLYQKAWQPVEEYPTYVKNPASPEVAARLQKRDIRSRRK